MENLRLLTSGRLVCDEHNFETKISKKDVDITNFILYAFSHNCVLESSLTLKSIFELVRNVNNYSILSPLLTGGDWLEEIIDEGLDKISTNKSSIQYINIGWRAVLHDLHEGGTGLDFDVDIYGSIDGDKEKYALDMSSTQNLMDCKVRLIEDIFITDETKNGFNILKQTQAFPILLTCKKEFTLFDILRGLFWELSFFGSPKERDAKKDELIESVKNIKVEECKSLDEVKQAIQEKRKCQKCSGEG